MARDQFFLEEANCLQSQQIHGYPIPHNNNKNIISMNITFGKTINKGSEVVMKEKLKYPFNITANHFSVTTPCFFPHRFIPTTNPIRQMTLNTIIKSIVCSILSPFIVLEITRNKEEGFMFSFSFPTCHYQIIPCENVCSNYCCAHSRNPSCFSQ